MNTQYDTGYVNTKDLKAGDKVGVHSTHSTGLMSIRTVERVTPSGMVKLVDDLNMFTKFGERKLSGGYSKVHLYRLDYAEAYNARRHSDFKRRQDNYAVGSFISDLGLDFQKYGEHRSREHLVNLAAQLRAIADAIDANGDLRAIVDDMKATS